MFKRFQDEYLMKLTLGVMIAGLVFLFLSPRIIIVVPAGSVGVLFRPLSSGTDITEVMIEGAQFVMPWNEVEIYDVRLQTVDQNFNIITKDGLSVDVNIEFRYRINSPLAGLLHREVGKDYLKVMLTPEVAAHAREIVAKYDAVDFYSSKRIEVQEEILEATRQGLDNENSYSAKGVILVLLDDVFIKGITLPPIVAASIERKVEQYQRQLEYDFRLQTEVKEAQRKAYEGEGVAKLFANIGERDIQSYLRLAGIEAMLKLAQSPGSKIVVVADPKGGIPVIINPDAPVGSSIPTPLPLKK